MKKLFLIILTALFLVTAGTAFALPFYNSNQATLAWNPVTTDVDGDPITGVITYQLWLANADTDPGKANPVAVADSDGNTSDTQGTITLGTKGRYYVGVQAILDDLISEINWGDEPANQETVELFGIRFAVPPHAPKDLRR